MYEKGRQDRLAWGAAKTPEVRKALVDLRALVREIRSSGGKPAFFFMKDEVKRPGVEISDLADAVNDDQLADECRAVSASWTRLFQLAPPKALATYHHPSIPPNPEPVRRYRQQLGEQIDEAHRCEELIEEALRRVNELQKKHRGGQT